MFRKGWYTMGITRRGGDAGGSIDLGAAEARALSRNEERELLRSLADCRRKLADLVGRAQGDAGGSWAASPAPSAGGEGLGAVLRRYGELRGRLALANVRLVAHVAKRFRDRGVAHADLLQEGFCGLLEAIDRFDLDRQTKLSTYATWWIRQAMQQAVASGAYPVRLTPRHLRQLAQGQGALERGEPPAPAPGDPSPEAIRRIFHATRPAVSLDAASRDDSDFRLLRAIVALEDRGIEDVDTHEAVSRMFQALRPREQEVLSMRFGLVGGAEMSLSQIGRLLKISKERVRQIQDRALEKLRAARGDNGLGDLLTA